MHKRPRTRLEQKEETRALLLRAGRKVFAKHGYDGASVALLCKAARVTHGALYHHFPSKTEVFLAVLEELTQELAAKVELAVAAHHGWSQVQAACRAYLDACTDPAVVAILFRDGPRVLKPEVFADIDHATNEPLVVGLLERWVEASVLRPMPVGLVARMLGGAVAEAGAAIGAANDAGATRKKAETVLLQWIATFRRDASS